MKPWLEDFGWALSVLLHRHAHTSCSTSRETAFSFSAADDAIQQQIKLKTLIPFSQFNLKHADHLMHLHLIVNVLSNYTLITTDIIVIVTIFMTFIRPHNYLFYYFGVAKWF